jgi:hypothetical protein
MTTLITAEYKGVPYSFQDDGWFNATAAAKRYGKLPNEWLRLPETKAYIAALDEISNAGKSRIWHKTKRGNNGGTWLHPKLAVRFAQWLDVNFAVWCDMQIDTILRGHVGSIDTEELSSVADRTGLFVAAVFSVIRHRLGFGTVYRAFNDAAGAANFRSMTKAQVRLAEPVAQRIANGTAPPGDWLLIESNRPDKQAERRQAELSFSPGNEPK